ELICRFFPDAPTLLPVARNSDIGRIREALQGRIPLRTKRDWDWGDNLLCTFSRFHWNHDACKWQMLLVPNAHEVLGKNHIDTVTSMWPQRCYGFVSTSAQLSNHQWGLLKTVFGPLLYRAASNTTDQRASVRVLWCQSPVTGAVDADSSLERKRKAYWHN